jgi:opacity protein-like surface antigen
MKFLFRIISILTLFNSFVIAQYKGNNIAISANYSYNTTAKIFLAPDANSFFDENVFYMEDIYSYSVEIRYRMSEDLILGFSTELMVAEDRGRNILTSRQFIVKDGFELLPFEFSAYYYLPFSTEDFKFYMGGGLGIYRGKRTREFGDINFIDVKSETGFGIQVSTGMDYIIFNNLSVRGELRFRDPEFKITNKYDNNVVNYEGRTFNVSNDSFTSKINLDGITFRIGAAFQFSLFN